MGRYKLQIPLVLLAFLTSCAELRNTSHHQSLVAPTPKVGETAVGAVKVGFYTVPLPAGTWTVSESTVTETKDVPEAKVILVQRLPNNRAMLSNAVVVETILAHHLTNYSSSDTESSVTKKAPAGLAPGEISDAFMTEAFFVTGPSVKKRPRGFTSTPSLMFVAPVKMTAANYGLSYIQANRLNYDSKDVFIEIGFQLASVSQKLFVSYYIDPRSQDILKTPCRIPESNWHPERSHLLNESDKAFLEDAKSYAKWLKTKLLEAFETRD